MRARPPCRRRPRGRAPQGHRAPGHQARQHLRHRSRAGQDPRLRPRQAPREPPGRRIAAQLRDAYRRVRDERGLDAGEDRRLRYQSATELRADLQRFKREIDSGRVSPAGPREKSVAVLYFEDLSGAKEDEYFLAAPRRQPAPHHCAARRSAHRHVRLGRALRPRAVGRVRGAGRDRAEHHPGPAGHAHPAGGEAAGRQAHRRLARLRPLPEGARLLPPHDTVRHRPGPPDVRARDPPRPRIRPRPRRDRERLRAGLRVAREGRALARSRPRQSR